MDIEDIDLKLAHGADRPSLSRTTLRIKKRAPALQQAATPSLETQKEEAQSSGSEIDDDQGNSLLPGKGKVWVKTWGCGHNSSDSEYMMGQLAAYGYTLVDDPSKETAAVWVLNSCTVKNPSETSLVNAIDLAEQHGIKVVVAGCVPESYKTSLNKPGDKRNFLHYSVVGVQQIDRIVEVVEETLRGNLVQILGPKKEIDGADSRRTGGAALSLPKIRRNPYVEIIPISTGCLNQCSYCKTVQARGKLASYRVEEIVDRAVQCLNEGVVEIWLSSEDSGCYGLDIGTNLLHLLHRLLKDAIEPHPNCAHVRLRLCMSNPNYILNQLDDLVSVFAHPNMYAFLHVPVQAGSNRVLAAMRREYTVAQFRHVVETLRERVPGMLISTDVICGFPTETEDEFEETLDLVRDLQFSVLNISKFYARSGTMAAKMPPVRGDVAKERSRKLTQLFYSFNPYAKMVGQRVSILVTEWATDKIHLVGHTKEYYQVLIRDPDTVKEIKTTSSDSKDPKDSFEEEIDAEPESYMGRLALVEITGHGRFHMFGKVLSHAEVAQPAVLPTNSNNQSPILAPTLTDSESADKQKRILLVSIVVVIILYIASKLHNLYTNK